MPSSQTKLGKLGIGTANPVDTFLRQVEFDPGVREEQRVSQGTAGTFYTDKNLVRKSRVLVTPSASFEPTAIELEALLNWAIGPSTGTPTKTFVPQTDPPLRFVHWVPVAGDPYLLASVGVDNLTISAGVGEPVSVSVDCVGMTYDDTASSFPAIAPDVVSYPFMLSDLSATGGVFTTGGVTRQPAGFSFRVSNFIDRGRFLNSLNLTRVQKMDMGFGVSFDVPSGDNPGLWKSGVETAVAMVATFKNINTGASFSITAPAVMFPSQAPRHARGGEGMVTIDGTCYRTGGTGYPVTLTINQG